MNVKDFKWTEKRFGLTFANILKKLGGLSKDGTDGSIEYKDDEGNVSKLVTDSNFSSLLAKNGLIEVKWQELKDKRDNGELIPGSLYRITDYNCTTTQENTQSAGHQFDIVLLALSENKLAEEGWAMMNESNIYDVTFDDGVTKKCYIYCTSIEYNFWNVVEVDTMLGWDEVQDIEINEDTKTAIVGVEYGEGGYAENLTYNYFQNSNLSAWKVWYCLDNDTARFAWADNGETPQIVDPDGTYTREPSEDITSLGLYAWEDKVGTLGVVYTKTEYPKVGDWNYDNVGDFNLSIGAVAGFGRGVIYRLIDEFNNDIKYDFKNIQFKRKLTDGQYDANGIETWCYTLNIWYNAMCQDASIVGNTLPNDEGYVVGVYDNKFGYATAYDLSLEGVSTFAFALGDNVVLSFDDAGYYVGIESNTIGNGFNSNTIGNGFSYNTIGNHFGGNIIGDDFTSNTIGNAFTINTIESGFTANVIGNYFGGNKIRGNFDTNTIGNAFNNKTINSNTTYKNYGNNGVELATKNDIGNIETALNNI